MEVGKEGERERERAPRFRAPSTDSINLNERLVVRFRAPSADSINMCNYKDYKLWGRKH